MTDKEYNSRYAEWLKKDEYNKGRDYLTSEDRVFMAVQSELAKAYRSIDGPSNSLMESRKAALKASEDSHEGQS